MPNGRSAAVRSHRRSGSRRGGRTAFYVAVPVIVALAAGAGVYGYQAYQKTQCTGQVTATIAAAPSTAPLLEQIARNWANTNPDADGTCAAVTVRAIDSNKVAAALQSTWPTGLGPQPDVWVPESSAGSAARNPARPRRSCPTCSPASPARPSSSRCRR